MGLIYSYNQMILAYLVVGLVTVTVYGYGLYSVMPYMHDRTALTVRYGSYDGRMTVCTVVRPSFA